MERKVIFYADSDSDPADHNNLQSFVRESIDHLVLDAVSPARAFAGFQGEVTGAAGVALSPGRFYSAGQVYASKLTVAHSFLAALPLATKKHALVVVYGQESETDNRPREFLINEETGASQPRAVNCENARICNVNFVVGQESADPVDPFVDAGVLAIARVVLTPTGVASITMLAENRLDSVASVAGRVGAVEEFVARSGPAIVALGGDIASLKANSVNLVGKEAFGRAIARLATIEEGIGIPANAADSDADFFLDREESDPAFAGYDALVAEGIRFAAADRATTQLALANLLEPRATRAGSLLFPTFAKEARLSVGPRQGEVAISSFGFQNTTMVQRTMSRTRTRYGEEFTVCTNSAWWATGQYDYAGGTFAKDGETFEQIGADVEFADGHAVVKRLRRFWTDSYEEPYWDRVTVDHVVPGAQVAETFLNGNAGWFVGADFVFTQLAATGDVTVALCETTRGMPDLENVIGLTTIARADLKLNDPTFVPFEPVFLDGGKRYALVIKTAANHFVATTSGENFPQGTFFTVLDGAYQQGDGTRDLVFTVYMAKFAQSRAVIELDALQLVGGMTAIDILADAIVPASCDLTYEVRVGSVWTPLGPTTASVLGAGGNIPGIVPLRAVFTGTPDVMPGLRLTGSRVTVSRPKTTLTHVSKPRTLPGAGSNQIRVIGRLEYFDAAHHSAACKLRTGGAFGAIVNASSYVDAIAEDGSIERTWIFNLGAAVTAYRIQFEATTDSALRTFHFGWRKDFAL